jgi:hypothetical protein
MKPSELLECVMPALLAAVVILLPTPAARASLRIVSYNIDDADQGNDNNITEPYGRLPAVLQAIGQHHIGTNVQDIDVLGAEELNPTTLPNLVTALNDLSGAGTYAYYPITDPTTGAGTDGLIYKTSTVQVVAASVIGTASGSGAARAPLRFKLRPIGYSSASDFYMYVSHYKASAGFEVRRNFEAAEIRADADALGSNVHVIYSGDFNLVGGSSEPAWATLTASGTGQAVDPTGTGAWTNSTSNLKYIYSESSTSLSRRYDFELVTSAMLNQPGVQLAPDTSDPFDGNFPSSKYQYAYEVFGNNGTAPLSGHVNAPANTALADLPNRTTVLDDLMEPYAGNNNEFVGSDHLPVIADYRVTYLPGDFNTDGRVDAADYVAWRNGLGVTYLQADYDVWRTQFGESAANGLGASSVVPEPSIAALLCVGLLATAFRRTPSCARRDKSGHQVRKLKGALHSPAPEWHPPGNQAGNLRQPSSPAATKTNRRPHRAVA